MKCDNKKRWDKILPKEKDACKIELSAQLIKREDGDFSFSGLALIKVATDEKIKSRINLHNIRKNEIDIELYVRNLFSSMMKSSPSSKKFGT